MSDAIDDQDIVDLWVRAGSDVSRNGGCPVCHQIFMVMLLKSGTVEGSKMNGGGVNENGTDLRFNVKTVNPLKPVPEFRSTGLRHVPALVHGSDRQYEHPDEILEYIDHVFPKPNLDYDHGGEAETAVKDVFSKFCFFIKDVNKDPKNLELELRKVNGFLLSKTTKYLCGDHPTHLDCQLMPKLHHVRLACEYLKSYKIPHDLVGIWRYMQTAYDTPEFVRSCPSDQEIILYWADRPDTKNLSAKEHKTLSKEEQRLSQTVPDDAQM